MFVPKSDEAIKVYEQQNAINKDWTLERYFLPKKYADSKLKSFEVHGGDIIVSCAGTIGEIYEIPESADSGVINQALMRVRVNDDVVDKNMFIIAFSNMIEAFTRTHSNGSAIKNIPPFADLKPMEVLLPTMAEQMKISDYFNNLDHLITLHQRKSFSQTSKIIVWEQRKVSEEVASIDTGKSKYDILEDGDYEILGSTGVIGYENSYDYEGDFLLTARVGANAGTLYRHSGKVKITDNTVFLQGNHIDFVFYLLDKFDLKKLSFGSGQPLIKASELKNLELLMPTNNEEKEKIANYFSNLDHLITLHRRAFHYSKRRTYK